MKKTITKLLSMSLLISCLPTIPAYAGTGVETPVTKLLYENTFDNGAESDLAEFASEDFYFIGYGDDLYNKLKTDYAAAGQPDGFKPIAVGLEKAELNGNVGIKRMPTTEKSNNTPIVVFDFRYQDGVKTPTMTPDGLKSGKYTLNFDFSVVPDDGINGEKDDWVSLILANCSHGNSANNLAHFDDGKWTVMPASNSWTYMKGEDGNDINKNMELDSEAVYNYKMVMDFDTHKIQHYLNDVYVTEVSFSGAVRFLEIVLNDDMDYFDNLKLEKEIKYPIEYNITTENKGNNFFGEEQMKLTVTAKNRGDVAYTENLVVKATNPQGGEEVTLKSEEITIPAKGEYTVNITEPFNKKYGSWEITAESERSRVFKARVARIVEVDTLNDSVAICVHLDGRHSGLDFDTTFDFAKKAGISMIRSDIGYNPATDANGKTIFNDANISSAFTEMVAKSKEYGIEILPILYYGSASKVGYDEDGGFNTSEEVLQDFREYYEDAARKFKAYGIEQFELGNEDNYKTKPATNESTTIMADGKKAILKLGKIYKEPGNYKTVVDESEVTLEITQEDILDKDNNQTGAKASYATLKNLDGTVIYEHKRCYEPESGATYAKILKAGYEGIKAGNPDAIVLNSGSSVVYEDDEGSASVRNQYEFADSLLATIAADEECDYYDAWGVHSYHGGAAPEAGDQWKQNTDFCDQQAVLTKLLEKHRQISKDETTGAVTKDVQRWTTEIGYSAAQSEERKYASWMTRLLALNFMGDDYGPYHDKFFIYAMYNHGFDKSKDNENTFGIVNNWKNRYWYENTAYTAKESYVTVAQWNNIMNGAKFVNVVANEESAGYVKGDETFTVQNFNMEFDRNGDKVNLVWDTVGETEMTIADDEEQHIKVYDMYGNILEETYGTSVTVTANSEPKYVEFTDPEPEICLYGELGEKTEFDVNADTGICYTALDVNLTADATLTDTAIVATDSEGKESIVELKGLTQGYTRIEAVFDLDEDKIKVYNNGEKLSEEAYTSDVVKLELKSFAGGYFKDFAIIHYPIKSQLPTYSMTECEYTPADETITVVLKSDLVVSGYKAPYGISLAGLNNESFNVVSGGNVSIESVTRGERAGEYILKLKY